MAQDFHVVEKPGGILIMDGQKEVFFYQRAAKSLDGNFKRAHYIHPLYGLDGAVLTEDFPEDHPHHRGIFWAWHQVLEEGNKIGDAWECRDFIWEVTDLGWQATEAGLQITARVLWKPGDRAGNTATALLEEICTIGVSREQSNYRRIDFDISLNALLENIELGGSEDDKGYGGFSVRLKLPEDIAFYSANGRVIPQENAVEAAPWMDISGSIGKEGAAGGIVIISRNPFDQAGTPWILRKEKSMQNAVFPGRKPVPLPKGTPLLLKYSLLVYEGDLNASHLRQEILKP